MSAPPYMKLFWADYHQDTRHLTRDEHGAYFLLLGEAWNRGGFLPDDDALLARWALATPSEWSALKPIVMSFFRPASKGRWRHKRISEELAAYDDVSRKRKAAGKKGGSTSRGKHTENQEANAEANDFQKPTKPEPEPEPLDISPLPPEGGEQTGFVLGDDPAIEPRRKPKRAIPNGFPDEKAIYEQQLAARAAGADVDASYQAQRFKGWALANDRKFANWPQAWRNWMDRAIHEAPKTAKPAAAVCAPTEEVWRSRVRHFAGPNRYWSTYDWGPPPGKDGCKAPPEIQREFGIDPARPQPVLGAA